LSREEDLYVNSPVDVKKINRLAAKQNAAGSVLFCDKMK